MRFVDVSGKLGQINKSIRESAQNKDVKNEKLSNSFTKHHKVSSILAQRITDKPVKAIIKGYKTLSERNNQKYTDRMSQIEEEMKDLSDDKLEYKMDKAKYKYDKQEYRLGNLEEKPVNPFYARARQNIKNVWETTKSLPGRAARTVGNAVKIAGNATKNALVATGKAIVGVPVMAVAGMARLTGRGAVKGLAAGVRATRTIKNKVHDMNLKGKFKAAKGTLAKVTEPARLRVGNAILQEVVAQDIKKQQFRKALTQGAPPAGEQQKLADLVKDQKNRKILNDREVGD